MDFKKAMSVTVKKRTQPHQQQLRGQGEYFLLPP
jgi:hypothetical protein